ncbi:PTS sorbitol transporter subunit IIA [Streptococcus chenjunshii]|uniref:PTS sorbitol transporter subunit IIA n=1 Tax=Streptococcus chenjunshii TaxID=2173853 RepID=A0A372KLE4_9STRE|nr:PTS glucitol/sorbitol transporter subunit IIA [Streptococcus chenjunshii]AXQ79636.1 PTS sorbitol transporter subunit IIA [Streptococcus chenjunshii]RFU51049.1 PTS sorbitol transporter subunit IIA [Streptococcus chenjunshii]RFU53093.1 PTS sorbitol transporter subunit IIA [Streptococcus chenjunshii]
MNIYETEILSIGNDAFSFLSENMLILFGEHVPPELMDFCFKIKVNQITGSIEPGMSMHFGDKSYLITSVGDDVLDNLNNLGHVTVKFDNAINAELPGTIHLRASTAPLPQVGDKIIIN